MKKIVVTSTFLLLSCLVTPQPGLGQRGPGGIIDWIHKLSGPSMIGPAASYYWTVGERGRFRASAVGRLPIGIGDTVEQDHTVNMLSLQPSFEYRIVGPMELNAGLALHRFGGRGHDPVWHYSVPVYGQLRTSVDQNDEWFFRLGLGLHYFPSFDEEDFDGGVTVSTDGGEVSFAIIVGFDYGG